MKEKCVIGKDAELICLLNLLFRTIFDITTWSSLSLSLSLSTGLISCVVQILISLYFAEPRSEPPRRVLLDSRDHSLNVCVAVEWKQGWKLALRRLESKLLYTTENKRRALFARTPLPFPCMYIRFYVYRCFAYACIYMRNMRVYARLHAHTSRAKSLFSNICTGSYDFASFVAVTDICVHALYSKD